MNQASLFADLPAPARALRVSKDGWIAHDIGAGVWTHPTLPAIEILHCGHPTAIWPYHINGLHMGFRRLDEAKAHALAYGADFAPVPREAA